MHSSQIAQMAKANPLKDGTSDLLGERERV
jgi:hypothetical protein